MVYQYVESRDRTPLSAFPQEEITAGNLIRVDEQGA